MSVEHISIEPVVFSNPEHLSQWYYIRSETSVRGGWRDLRKIKPDEHRAWWEGDAKKVGLLLFFIWHEGQIVGILRLDHRGSWTEVWIAIKPEQRRRGFARQALTLISAKAQNLKWPPLGAFVNGQKNTISWWLFTRAGFTPKNDGFIQLIQKGRVA